MDPITWLSSYFIAIVLILFLLSYLYKDNTLFRFAEYTFAGFSVGWSTFIGIQNIQRSVIAPLQGQNYIFIIPLILGILMFTQFHRKTIWLSRWPSSILVGAGFGATMTSAMSVDVVQQVIGTIGAPVTGVPASTAINNVLLMICVVCAILYFFFSSMRGYATKAPMKQIIRTGRIIVLVSIGAMFGLQLTAYTVIMMDIFNYVLTGIRLLIL